MRSVFVLASRGGGAKDSELQGGAVPYCEGKGPISPRSLFLWRPNTAFTDRQRCSASISRTVVTLYALCIDLYTRNGASHVLFSSILLYRSICMSLTANLPQVSPCMLICGVEDQILSILAPWLQSGLEGQWIAVVGLKFS